MLPNCNLFTVNTDSNGYHTPFDRMENLNIKKLKTVGKMVVKLVRDLTNDYFATERAGRPKPQINPDNPGKVWPGAA